MSQYSSFKVDLSNTNSTWTQVFNKIKPESVILDIGCSSGYFDSELINKKNCIVDGFELNKKDSESAEKVCRSVRNDNVEDYVFTKADENKYDYILFLDVLEHLVDPAKVLKKCKKLLKNSGQIIFSIPNMAHASVRLELLNGSFEYEDEGLLDRTHLHFYEKNNILELIQKSHYRLVEMINITRDIDLVTMKYLLKNAGLKPTKEFISRMQTEEALTYQYVTVITPSNGKNLVNKQPETKFKAVGLYEKQIKALQRELRRALKAHRQSEKERLRLIEQNTKYKLIIKKVDIFRLHKLVKKIRLKK
jgi:2-polyprenyl-3-methyl-5-hydroxy-6-metoxy-1,4-benzoquinol methylase